MIVDLPADIDEVLDLYEVCRQAIFKHVGYVEDWVVLPLDDQRSRYWCVDAGEQEHCYYADSEEELRTGGGKCYSGEIYTQRFLNKWVYRGAKLTLVLVDTRCDGNKFLMLFDNAKERPGVGGKY